MLCYNEVLYIMFKKKIAIAITLMLLTFAICGCSISNSNQTQSETTENTTETSTVEETTTEDTETVSENTVVEDVEILNFTPPEIGEEIAVITVKDYGQIKIKLFPDQCPNGVENFKRLISEKDYYSNVIFHRVIADFVIQAGDPNGNGTGGESIWGDGFEREFDNGLRHFAGAVAYATNNVDHLNKSQFYIVCQNDGSEFNDSYFDMVSQSYNTTFPENVREKYKEVGGTPFLDNNYEVFGQVFEGMDVVMAISQAKTDGNDKPYNDIVIESATIEEYDGSSTIGSSEE